MQFKDPFQVACQSCGSRGEHRVRELLNLRAICGACGVVLDRAGREMRATMTEVATLFGTIDAVLDLEKPLGTVITDADLEPVRTGLDLLSVIRGKMTGDGSENLAQCVRAALEAARRAPTSLADLERPLADLFAGDGFDFASG
jgi:hypothetical protein